VAGEQESFAAARALLPNYDITYHRRGLQLRA
jgi:hypothetical protein